VAVAGGPGGGGGEVLGAGRQWWRKFSNTPFLQRLLGFLTNEKNESSSKNDFGLLFYVYYFCSFHRKELLLRRFSSEKGARSVR
jgi:hypothetical protein